MSDKLKKFVSEHRQEFDTSEPGNGLWEKIDARMGAKQSSRISSKWLSTFKYLGFGASVLVVAAYFMTRNVSPTSANGLALNTKDSAMRHSEQNFKADQHTSVINVSNTTTSEINDASVNENKSRRSASASLNNKEQNIYSTHRNLPGKKNNPAVTVTPVEAAVSGQEKTRPESFPGFSQGEAGNADVNSLNEKKENEPAGNTAKTELYIPEEPEVMNSYTGTLYESVLLCDVLHAYKFPGRVRVDKDGWNDHSIIKPVVRTISCSRLENMANVKVVWLKGITDKEITLSVKKRFKNIVLLKRDGREINPEAISHYYPGLGVITEYKGKYFNMIFKDKVELLLFFKDAEEGDKVVIDGAIEALVKGKP